MQQHRPKVLLPKKRQLIDSSFYVIHGSPVKTHEPPMVPHEHAYPKFHFHKLGRKKKKWLWPLIAVGITLGTIGVVGVSGSVLYYVLANREVKEKAISMAEGAKEKVSEQARPMIQKMTEGKAMGEEGGRAPEVLHPMIEKGKSMFGHRKKKAAPEKKKEEPETEEEKKGTKRRKVLGFLEKEEQPGEKRRRKFRAFHRVGPKEEEKKKDIFKMADKELQAQKESKKRAKKERKKAKKRAKKLAKKGKPISIEKKPIYEDLGVPIPVQVNETPSVGQFISRIGEHERITREELEKAVY